MSYSPQADLILKNLRAPKKSFGDIWIWFTKEGIPKQSGTVKNACNLC
jgi:hypothetical protein